MEYTSNNMNYIFYVEYFKELNLLQDSSKEIISEKERKQKEKQEEIEQNKVKNKNKALEMFHFPIIKISDKWKDIPGFQKIQLYTCYPGLMTGIGGNHGLNIEGIINCNFAFDYVTGVPYLPGSELKGLLRSCFPGDEKDKEISEEYESYIRGLLGEKSGIDILELKNQIFENQDVFLGGYSVVKEENRSLLLMESITPHKEKFKNPIPLSMLKVKPNIMFEFCFLLKDYRKDGKIIVSAEEKLDLFKQLILDMGAGAKTNVGFGRFAEKPMEESEFLFEENGYESQKKNKSLKKSPQKRRKN